jgi:UDP-glucose 4-epimerase
MKFVVTGGAGFIGSHLAEELIKRGFDVIVIDDLSLGVKENIPKEATFIKGSSSKIQEVPGSVDGIFHLGMPSSSPMYKEDPYLVGKTINEAITIFEYARKNQCKVVYASTSSIYNGNSLPYKEDMPIHVTDYYTECRYAIERLAKLYYDLYNVKSIGLRLFSVYGPREEHKGKYANIISQFLWAMLKDQSPIIYGDGNQTRDFIYVSDVVNAFILAIFSNIDYDIFNVGTGRNYSFNEVIKIINKLLNKDIKPIYKPNPIKNYVYHTLADTTKAEKILGFKAKISLEEGIKKLISKALFHSSSC